MSWEKVADDEAIGRTANALKEKGFEVAIAKDGNEAKRMAMELIPEGAEVLRVTSATLDEIGLVQELDSDRYRSLRKEINAIDDQQLRLEKRRASISPEYGIGSVQALTEDGRAVMASASGSQLPVYVYGARNVIWIVGAQKIVKNLDEAFKRIYEHALPLESERIRNAGMGQASSVNKILIIDKERPNRIKVIIVKEKLGF
ncbi:MAG: lactate utilization protein [Candidatus Micrarchaeota archaeon]|nr:lactate utilization protein [Candidatus Micrarchaeota archaeon]MDE1823859.1 lactate utilization protein [Candidatus Micrarchaeota archaeon]MDE1849451.1 lactate utilization protein [Candidatus Micrarchaeota archaeon]